MKVAIIGLGYRLGYLGHVFTEMDPDFQIVGYYDPAPPGCRRFRNKASRRVSATPRPRR